MAAILVVDDDPVTSMILSRMLKGAGHEVRVASDGLDAIRKLEEDRVDLLITDLSMPKMSGRELSDHLRADPRFDGLPIFLMTGVVDPEKLHWIDEAVDIELIEKPVDLSDLLDRIQKQIG